MYVTNDTAAHYFKACFLQDVFLGSTDTHVDVLSLRIVLPTSGLHFRARLFKVTKKSRPMFNTNLGPLLFSIPILEPQDTAAQAMIRQIIQPKSHNLYPPNANSVKSRARQRSLSSVG